MMTKAGLVHERAASPSIQVRSSEKASAHRLMPTRWIGNAYAGLAVMLHAQGSDTARR